jgi:hypothetical protein
LKRPPLEWGFLEEGSVRNHAARSQHNLSFWDQVLRGGGKDLDDIGEILGVPPRGFGESDQKYRRKILDYAMPKRRMENDQ